MSDKSISSLLFLGIVVLIILVLVNSFLLLQAREIIDEKISEAKESARPGKIELIQINSQCSDCFNLTETINYVKSAKVELIGEKSFESSSQEAQDLLKKYQINKLPALIAKGEIDKVSLRGFVKNEDALVFNEVLPPYQNTDGSVIGKVSAIILNYPECAQCADFNLLINDLKENKIFVETVENKNYNDGKELIAEYSINKLPAILLSKDIDSYPEISGNLKQISKDAGKYYVLESGLPYFNVSSKRVSGLINVMFLTDQSCKECFDINILRTVLLRIGLSFGEEKTLNISSKQAQNFIQNYKIELIPTAILTGDLEEYSGFDKAWIKVGTIEKDGAYIFRKPEILGPDFSYKNTSSGLIISPPKPEISITEPEPAIE